MSCDLKRFIYNLFIICDLIGLFSYTIFFPTSTWKPNPCTLFFLDYTFRARHRSLTYLKGWRVLRKTKRWGRITFRIKMKWGSTTCFEKVKLLIAPNDFEASNFWVKNKRWATDLRSHSKRSHRLNMESLIIFGNKIQNSSSISTAIVRGFWGTDWYKSNSL